MSLQHPRTEGEHMLAKARRALPGGDFDIIDKSSLPAVLPNGEHNPYREEGFILIATGALEDVSSPTAEDKRRVVPKYADKILAGRAADAAAGREAAKRGIEIRREPDDSVAWVFRYAIV